MIRLKCIDAYCKEDKLWTIDNFGCFLFSVDLKTWTLKMEQDFGQAFLIDYRKVIENNNILYFIKAHDLEMFIYDMNLKQGHVFKQSGISNITVSHMFFYKSQIIIIPLYIHEKIYGFDINSCEFYHIKIFSNKKKSKIEAFVPSAVLKDDTLWFVIDDGMCICSYDFQIKKSTEYRLPCGICVGGLGVHRDRLLLVSRIGYEVYVWNCVGGIINKYSYNGFYDPKDTYAKLEICADYIYLVSRHSNEIYKVDEDNRNVDRVKTVEIDKNSKAKSLFMEIVNTGREIYILPWRAKNIVEVNCNTDEIVEHEIIIGKNDMIKIVNSVLKRANTVYETNDISCSVFAKGLLNERKINDKKALSSGRKLYQLLSES